MLGENRGVFLVHANAVGDRLGVAIAVSDHGGNVVDFAQAIAAELQRIGQPADQVFSGVEVVLPAAHR
ncbi:hypothetical protein D3C74_460180 [compost metagenome]